MVSLMLNNGYDLLRKTSAGLFRPVPSYCLKLGISFRKSIVSS